MRITNSMSSRNVLQYLEQRLEGQYTIQNQIAGGKRIDKPSDDPLGTDKALSYRHQIARNQQHLGNVQDGLSYMSYTDGILDSIGGILNRAQALAVEGSNAALNAEDRQALANEVDQLLEELVNEANSSLSGKSIFGGYNYDSQPFTVTRDANDLITSVTANPAGIDDGIEREVGVGMRETINIGGENLFQPDGAGAASDMFKSLIDLRDALINNDPTAAGAQIEAINDRLEHMNYHRATLGARVSYFNRREEQLNAELVRLEENLSGVEDTDIIEAAIRYEEEQAAYQAALAVSAQIMRMNLGDYI